jgi:dihydroneopterin aldolase
MAAMLPTLAPAQDPLLPGPFGAEALDLVFIEGFSGRTVIGIHPGELHAPQPVTIDLCAGVPRLRACESDAIGDTIDYGELRQRLHGLLRDHRVQLLEGLAEQVARICIQEFHAHWVRVRVGKPRKFEDTECVGVVIERRRAFSPAATGPATLRLIGRGLVPGSR